MARRKRDHTKLEARAASLTSGVLKDQTQRYLNSAGSAIRHFEQTADPAALDVIIENVGIVAVLAAELRQRTLKDNGGYFPQEDPHLEDLTRKFLARHV